MKLISLEKENLACYDTIVKKLRGEKMAPGVKLQDAILKLESDATGILSLDQCKESRLKEAALKLLPVARSVVVFAMEIYPEILELTSPRFVMGEAPMNDLVLRNADYVNGRLTKTAYDMVKAAHSLGFKALPLSAAGCPLDTRFMKAVFSYKHAGLAAGLGKIGKHSLLITPRFGPRVRLSCCITEAELEPTPVSNANLECESCNICINNCPSGALSEPAENETYSINKYACNYFRSGSGGCFECMRLCPMGH